MSFRTKKIKMPSTPTLRTRNIVRSKKRERSPVRLEAIAEILGHVGPTLVFKRRYPKIVWLVPPITTPMYWFDMVMVKKGLIVAIPPNTFVVDGRRFKVLAQDQKIIGIGYTRWLCYEEAAVAKGERP